ncbi:MAG TPA: hypothetical protein VMH80_08030 [Bryobacteraceae bacterium]|nr:hypothetical protein [Bryobacteraceae bacterium]
MRHPKVRGAWGIEEDEDVAAFSARVYAAKFDFQSGGPGYVGDLYVLQGDAITDDGPMVLRRDSHGPLATA